MPGTSIMSAAAASWRSATPWRVLIASASAVGVRSAMAMSLVIWSPAIGITAGWGSAPWGEMGGVGGAAADVEQAHAEVLLVLGQHGARGGERLQDEVVHLEAAAAHA